MLDNFILYLKKSVFDIVLCIASVFGITINAVEAFYVPSEIVSNDLAVLAIISIIQSILFILYFNKKYFITAISLMFLGAISIIYTISRGIITIEKELISFSIIVLFISFCVFLFSRFLIGSIFIFLLGIGFFFILVLLGYNNHPLGLALFLLSSACIFFLRNYTENAKLHSDNAGIKSGFNFAVTASLICIAGLGISLGVYQLIIKPINPPANDIALITVFKSMNILKKAGISSEIHLYKENLAAKASDDNRIIQQNLNPEQFNSTITSQEQTADTINNPDNISAEVNDILNELANSDADKVSLISYQNKNYIFIILPTAIILVIALSILIKMLHRKHFISKIKNAPNKSDRIIALYKKYLKKLALIGMKKNESDTLFEYAQKVNQKFKGYDKSDIDLIFVTDVYSMVKYGNMQISGPDYLRFIEFYKSFLLNAKNYLGFKKFCLYYFAL